MRAQEDRGRAAEPWRFRPGPDADEVFVRHGPRERLFEAYRVGVGLRQQHCRSCGRPLLRGTTAYREQAPPESEPVSWREVRFCRECATGEIASEVRGV